MPERRLRQARDHRGFGQRLACLLALALVVAAGGATAADAAEPFVTFDANSADGKVVVFTTNESLVPGDTDHEPDVYMRSKDESLGQYVTREVSIGPTGGNDAQPAQFDGLSADGTKVFFSTEESLVSSDTDRHKDIYMRNLTNNTTTWVSQGAASCVSNGCGNGGLNANFARGGLTPDGNRVFFETKEQLVPADTDNAVDLYMRDLSTETTTLVSQGASSCTSGGCGNGPLDVSSLEGISTTGSIAVFTTNESLSAEDTDEIQDVYLRNLETETTTLVSTPGTCPPSLAAEEDACSAVFGGMSKDGSHVFFETREPIVAGDQDESQDVYQWFGGTVSLVSTGPDGGNAEKNATYAGSSSDGSVVYFETNESLSTSEDTDEARDIYERTGGETKLVSPNAEGGNKGLPAEFKWASPDGSSEAVIFTTEEALTSSDTDAAQDVYMQSGGKTTLLSIGPEGGNGAGDASFAGASHDGTKVFFVTPESLLGEDKDSSRDIYERSGETTTLISTGPEGGNGAYDAGLNGLSANGEYDFFSTEEHLTEGDTDAELDIYQRTPAGTFLVSTGNQATFGPRTPTLTGTSPASPNESTTPSIRGTAAAETAIKIYTTSDCSKEPVATGTVAELEGAGIPAGVAAGSTTSFRATAEVEGLVSPCSAPISYTQQDASPPPTNEEGAGGGGGTGGGGSGGGGGGGLSGGGSTTRNGVHYVTPETAITFGPSSKTRKRRPVFRFDDATEQPGSEFFCKIDRHRWRSCGSPQKLTKLSPGRHTFEVRAVNVLGVSDPSPVRRTFKVVR